MKKLFILCLFILASCTNKKKETIQIAEISCGQCQFGIKKPKGCDLAIRLDGKAYFIDGAHIDDFGDAHDKTTGFCEVIRKAEIIGFVKQGKFKASSVKLIE